MCFHISMEGYNATNSKLWRHLRENYWQVQVHLTSLFNDIFLKKWRIIIC